ncbi:hypothetical protein T11_767 [Trichinella zimbabwensis]|uniref:Uncharacterized protein n=1 Tax=Trichinella zimbabwensis TaxID=268475 RepID=A0A0V1H6E2_9BILA|nr:hypothetical protein T11_767 [Trichinella zimbabwensis]
MKKSRTKSILTSLPEQLNRCNPFKFEINRGNMEKNSKNTVLLTNQYTKGDAERRQLATLTGETSALFVSEQSTR